MRGSMSYIHSNAVSVVGRAHYIKMIQQWREEAK
jgi:hypothetical protein